MVEQNDELDDRATRERERYNEGLKRDRYDRSLNPAKVYFLEDRRRVARSLFEAHAGAGPVLEIGSAQWFGWIEKNGVIVEDLTCINVSEAELDIGKELAKTTTNRPKFIRMDAQKLEFPDNHFEIVFGSAILHHLEFEQSLIEIKRVLKPGGKMFFSEPMGINPVGKLVRRLTPEARTEDERPFGLEEFRLLDKHFDTEYTFEGLFSVPAGVVSAILGAKPKNVLTRSAYHVDRALRVIPGAGYLFRHVFLIGSPKPT